MSDYVWYAVHDNCDVEMIDMPGQDIDTMQELEHDGTYIYTNRNGHPCYVYAKKGLYFI